MAIWNGIWNQSKLTGYIVTGDQFILYQTSTDRVSLLFQTYSSISRSLTQAQCYFKLRHCCTSIKFLGLCTTSFPFLAFLIFTTTIWNEDSTDVSLCWSHFAGYQKIIDPQYLIKILLYIYQGAILLTFGGSVWNWALFFFSTAAENFAI